MQSRVTKTYHLSEQTGAVFNLRESLYYSNNGKDGTELFDNMNWFNTLTNGNLLTIDRHPAKQLNVNTSLPYKIEVASIDEANVLEEDSLPPTHGDRV